MKTKVLNPFSVSLKKDPFMILTDLVHENGDYKIYKHCKEWFVHTFKNIVIAERCAPNKNIITNLKGETRPEGIADIYHQLERPQWAINEGIKQAKKLNFTIN